MMAENGQVFIDYGKFGEHADAIDRKNKEMRETLDEIQKKINGLKGDFESNSAEAIRQKITNMSGRFDKYQQVVDNYVKFIRNAAIQIENIEKVNSSNADQFK